MSYGIVILDCMFFGVRRNDLRLWFFVLLELLGIRRFVKFEFVLLWGVLEIIVKFNLII